MSDTKLRFTDEQLKEFAAYHDKFLRGIGCRRDNFHRKRMYLLEKKFHQYYLRFDTGIENQDIDGACDPLTVSIFMCPRESSDYENDILIRNTATHEEVMVFIEVLEMMEK